jgi:flagellar assembly protein FliH
MTMSKMTMSDALARRVEIGELCTVSSGFRPLTMVTRPSVERRAVADDLYQRGFEAGSATAAQVFETERTRLIELLESCQALEREPSDELASLIAETVLQLVTTIVGKGAVDSDLLLARAKRAAALIAKADGERTLHMHPDDLPVIEGAALPLKLVADKSMTRGSVRICCSTGWVEDGTSVFLDALRTELNLP